MGQLTRRSPRGDAHGRILVTPRSLTRAPLSQDPSLIRLIDRGFTLVSGPPGRLPTEDELRSLVKGCAGWLAGVEVISAETLNMARDLRVISRNGAGADSIDLPAARRLGIRVTTAPGANAQGVAELALLLMLASLRDLPRSNREMHEGNWSRWIGRELADRTVGVVGLGAVGRLVARLVNAFGAQVIAHDPYLANGTSGVDIPLMDLPELFAQADVITLHCPATQDGSPLITRELLDMLVRGSVLVNTARWSLVDDGAVLDALESGTLSSYAVDTFDTEPPPRDRLLLDQRTITTPHIGGYTDASSRRAVEQAVTNLIDILGTAVSQHDAVDRARL